jgi:dTMP kinase
MPTPQKHTGYFITLEGIEGVGKSTCLKFIHRYLALQKINTVTTREPGGTPIAEAIRQLLLNSYKETVCDDTELLLFFAGRAQHLAQVILPALSAGKWVLCDRFTDASYAYQGGGRGFSKERIAILEQWVQKGLKPDLTLLFDAPIATAFARVKKRGRPDRIEAEQKQFFTRVRNCYLERAKQEPQRFRVIDARQPLAMVKKQLRDIIDEVIQKQGVSIHASIS